MGWIFDFVRNLCGLVGEKISGWVIIGRDFVINCKWLFDLIN